MMTVDFVDPKTGASRSYKIKLYEELTIADYKLLTDIPWKDLDEDWDTEGKCAVIDKYCNIPPEIALRLPMNELQAVYAKAIEQPQKAQKGSDAINAAIKDNAE